MCAVRSATANVQSKITPPNTHLLNEETCLNRTAKIALLVIALLAGFLVLPFEMAITLSVVVTIGAVAYFGECNQSRPHSSPSKPEKKGTPHPRVQSPAVPASRTPISQSSVRTPKSCLRTPGTPVFPRIVQFANVPSQVAPPVSRAQNPLASEVRQESPLSRSIPSPSPEQMVERPESSSNAPPSNARKHQLTFTQIIAFANLGKDCVTLQFNDGQERSAFVERVRSTISDLATVKDEEPNSKRAFFQLTDLAKQQGKTSADILHKLRRFEYEDIAE